MTNEQNEQEQKQSRKHNATAIYDAVHELTRLYRCVRLVTDDMLDAARRQVLAHCEQLQATLDESLGKHRGILRLIKTSALFPLGDVLQSHDSLELVSESGVAEALARHVCGDWGIGGVEDWAANDRALFESERLLSVYRTPAGVEFWVITEDDRSMTTILLPSDFY